MSAGGSPTSPGGKLCRSPARSCPGRGDAAAAATGPLGRGGRGPRASGNGDPAERACTVPLMDRNASPGKCSWSAPLCGLPDPRREARAGTRSPSLPDPPWPLGPRFGAISPGWAGSRASFKRRWAPAAGRRRIWWGSLWA